MAGTIFEKGKPFSAKTVMTHPVYCLAFGLGVGLSPVAPGTLGSLLGLWIAYLLAQFSTSIYIATAVVLTVLGVFVADITAKRMGEQDPGGIVIDEIVAVIWVFAFFKMTWATLILGFGLFRLFDILKPWPIGYIDKHLKGGLGIMADDWMAALFTVLSLWGIIVLSHRLWV